MWPKMCTDAISVLNGRLPEISTTEPNSPTARAKREAGAGDDRRQQAGQHDAAEHREAAGAERAGGLLHVAVELHEHGLHGAHHERQGDEQQREQQATRV